MIIYGLMKFIEQIPERYDRMIGFLTLGGHTEAQRLMLEHIHPGTRILDIGCGTGTFLLEAASRGAICVGVDAAVPMLNVFRKKLESVSEEVRSRITIIHQSATLLEKSVPQGGFDMITSSLMLGELPTLVLDAVLKQIPGLLRPEARLFIADELWPQGKLPGFM